MEQIITIFLKILNMSITASYVIGIISILRLFLKRVPKLYSYLLWGIVLYRLVCPVSFVSKISLLPSSNTIRPDIIYNKIPEIDSGITTLNRIVNPVLARNLSATPFTVTNPIQSLAFTGSVIWIFGIILLLLYSIINYYNIHRQVKASIPLRDNIYQCDKISSPFVFGLINPRIYIPFHLKEQELSHVLAHEAMHIRHYDQVMKLLFFLAAVLHWFNPFVWLSYYLMSKDMEMVCDEAVMKHMGTEFKKEYSRSLLLLASNKPLRPNSPLAFGVNNTRERVKNILHYKKPVVWVLVIVILVCSAIGIMCLANPGKDTIKVTITSSQDKSITNIFKDLSKETMNSYDKSKESIDMSTTDSEAVNSNSNSIYSNPISLETLDGAKKEELLKRLSQVTLGDLKKAKKIMDKGWETSICLLAELPSDHIRLYGYNDRDFGGVGVILQVKDKLLTFDWLYLTPRLILPTMNYFDYDNDKVKELAISCYVASGTGFAIEQLYLLEPTDMDSFIPTPFLAADYISQLEKRITYQYDKDTKTITVYDGQNKLRETTFNGLKEDENARGLYLGNIVHFNIKDKLTMTIPPGVVITGWATPLYDDGLEDFEVDIEYKNGIFTLTNIR
ncbi:M56 family metallopeptidase [Anaerocolumna sp. AGMB13025]|uniref:M56 family metallopeptidase n=1 Tax=Anaerocolumna sp. AGMB13025 TaxID=3039116 RepID=UPI00241BFA78|nr:M56 family metallopeptidase [Anaerocolumna sp. AGMB13025]WFR58497.1 M56 family metallopeptidase [Anaerocolumna sp. AGMB13025]